MQKDSVKMSEGEVWRFVSGSTTFLVSSYGKVYNITTQQFVRGYRSECTKSIGIIRDGRFIIVPVAQLVAEAFVDNPHQFTRVEFLDGNPKNLRYTNLAWSATSKKTSKNGQPVLQFTMSGEFVAFYASKQEAAQHLGCSSSVISYAVSGKRSHAKGYKFVEFNPEVHTKYLTK